MRVEIYVKNSPEAVEWYKSASGRGLGYHVLNDDGTYFHSELTKHSESFCSVIETKSVVYDPIGRTFETRGELEHAFSVLRDGGKVEMDIRELPWSPCAAIDLSDRLL